MRRLIALILPLIAQFAEARAHDIPNARVDRSIQATLRPGRLEIDYEVSLSELTLTQDLRSLIGSLPGADRQDWFDQYGRVTGPLNAKGVLVTVSGVPVALHHQRFDLVVEDHPRYTFHFAGEIPTHGRLVIHDTNFSGSEGTSRLALRAVGVTVRGDDLPEDVEKIPVRPAWQLTDAEDRRTKQLAVEYSAGAMVRSTLASPSSPARTPLAQPSALTSRLSQLLDRSASLPVGALALIAFGLGVAHALQPGHGKTLVTATVIGEGGSWLLGATLAVAATLAHTASVTLIAAGLWLTRSSEFAPVHLVLAHLAGFAIAANGVWRLGRHLAGFGEHDEAQPERRAARTREVIGLGIAGGLVPTWEAVGLLLIAAAVGRLALGVGLVVAFGLGMAVVLVVVGAAAARLRSLAVAASWTLSWERPVGLASSLALAAVGMYLLWAS